MIPALIILFCSKTLISQQYPCTKSLEAAGLQSGITPLVQTFQDQQVRKYRSELVAQISHERSLEYVGLAIGVLASHELHTTFSATPVSDKVQIRASTSSATLSLIWVL